MIKLGYFQAVFKRKIQTNNNTACVVDKLNPEAKVVRRRLGRYWCEALARPFFRVVRENVDFAELVNQTCAVLNRKQETINVSNTNRPHVISLFHSCATSL